jgi:hypothetical protein
MKTDFSVEARSDVEDVFQVPATDSGTADDGEELVSFPYASRYIMSSFNDYFFMKNKG